MLTKLLSNHLLLEMLEMEKLSENKKNYFDKNIQWEPTLLMAKDNGVSFVAVREK